MSNELSEEKKAVLALSGKDEMLFADGLDEAIIGYFHDLKTGEKVVVYDSQKCAEILVERDGMDEDEAWEYLEFNTFDAYVGVKTPLFIEQRWK